MGGEEDPMDKTRINVANPQELLEIPGMDAAGRDAIVRHRTDHGPIRNSGELAKVLGRGRAEAAWDTAIDFDPADDTAPEAPGA
jgi:DNA uptake protein ComE-like DNA-binding protein